MRAASIGLTLIACGRSVARDERTAPSGAGAGPAAGVAGSELDGTSGAGSGGTGLIEHAGNGGAPLGSSGAAEVGGRTASGGSSMGGNGVAGAPAAGDAAAGGESAGAAGTGSPDTGCPSSCSKRQDCLPSGAFCRMDTPNVGRCSSACVSPDEDLECDFSYCGDAFPPRYREGGTVYGDCKSGWCRCFVLATDGTRTPYLDDGVNKCP